MSNVLKLNKAKRLNVQLLDDVNRKSFHVPSPEEVMKKKMEQSYHQGLNDGRKAAEIELTERYNRELEAARNMIEQIAEKVDEKLTVMERHFGENIFKLALMISEKIIRREIEADSPVEENVKMALNKIVGASAITIRINPAEQGKIRKSLSTDSSVSVNRIKFDVDNSVQPGECIVESDIGNVDTRIASQLEEIKKHFDTFFDEK